MAGVEITWKSLYSYVWHLMLTTGWNTCTLSPCGLGFLSSWQLQTSYMKLTWRAPKAHDPGNQAEAIAYYELARVSRITTLSPKAAQIQGGRNRPHLSVKGMSKAQCQSIWGGRYYYSHLWKVSSATVLEIFPLEWGPWLNFLSVFFRPITQYLFLTVIF